MSAKRIGLGVITVFVLVAAVMWITSTVAWRLVAECGNLEPAACDQAWDEAVEDMGDWGLASVLPVTKAHLSGATAEHPMCGSTFVVERMWGALGRSVTYDC